MEAEPRKRHPARRPALLAGAAACAGCAAAAILPGWIGLVGVALLAVAAVLARLSRPRAAMALTLVAVALSFAGYGAFSSRLPADDLAALYPDGADLARVEGVLIEGGSYIQRDPAAFEYPESPDTDGDFPIQTDPRRSVTWLLRVDALPDAERPARYHTICDRFIQALADGADGPAATRQAFEPVNMDRFIEQSTDFWTSRHRRAAAARIRYNL